MKISPDKLQKLNDLLTILRENESISPYYLSIKSKIPMEKIIRFLNAMVERSMLSISFILRCNNNDYDLVHGYEFYDEDSLIEFLRKNKKCNQCEAELVSNDIRVFYKKNAQLIGDNYG